MTTAQGSFVVDFTVQGGPPCYAVTSQTGQPIITATTDLGNHCDDCTTAFTLPFPVTLYGRSHTEARISSNGNIQFDGTRNTAFINNCLPTTALQSAVIIYWDDLLTTGSGHGIFHSTTGSPPNRQLVVEWRTGYANRAGEANFEAIFDEGSDVIRMRYGVDVDHGASVTIGLQGSPTRGDRVQLQRGHARQPWPAAQLHADDSGLHRHHLRLRRLRRLRRFRRLRPRHHRRFRLLRRLHHHHHLRLPRQPRAAGCRG